ncbi:hypothetical protein [Nonomuraea sp. SYSU D8015]|uniref:hypothetical protein n=1 Tax=Nonomuraea sp. SYSU D8015 TaxID=2593644 RepID=UPI0016607ED2|nr:hypothetical protein [Nonomuraea sp. SYSU D8015]
MLTHADLYAGMPVIIEGKQADIIHYRDEGLVAESLLPISPNDSRHVQWTLSRDMVSEAISYDAERDFAMSGSVLCDDCGLRLRPRSLESLPEHACSFLQLARQEAS